MFRRVISMMLDRTLSTPIRTQLLCFLIHAFQSLDCAIIRKECAPLVSIGVWHNLSSDNVREAQLSQNTHLKKAWRAALKRWDAADDATKSRLRFERSWLYTLLLDFLSLLFEAKGKTGAFRYIKGELYSSANPGMQRRHCTASVSPSSSRTSRANYPRGAISILCCTIYISFRL